MPFAITLKAANDTAGPIRALWEEVADLESRSSMAALDYPPHLTLGIYDEVSPDLLKTALLAAFAETHQLRLTFTRLSVFEGVPLVLWAEPSRSAALASAHARVHARVDPTQCRPYYRPGAWVPHCTLASQILPANRAKAIEFAARPIRAFEVTFDVADCVSFPPVAVIDEQPLREGVHGQG